MSEPVTVAAVQAAPVFLDRRATIEKACALIANAAARNARLIVLPEAFVPGYPAWVWYLPLTRRAEIAMLYRTLVEQSITVPGPETERLGRAAREANAWVAIGVDELNATSSRTSLYNTLLLFDPEGQLVSRHRKLMPTGGERMIWTAGTEADLVVRETPFGRVGGLICWENYMPLARYALYQQGMEILLAPTWDKSDQWIASMRHIAREGRTYVIGVCQALHRDQVPDRYGFKDALPIGLQWLNVGNSLIVDPEGAILAGPIAEREEILYAEIDAGKTTGSRWIFDAAGHYDRPDLFHFGIAEPNGTSATAAATPRANRSAAKPKRRRAAPAKRAARPKRASGPRRRASR